MGVRPAPQITYLKDRLAGRAGRMVRPLALVDDPGADRRPARRTPLWVLPSGKPYTGAEGAEDVSDLIFSAPFCFCSDFGR